MSWRSRRSWRRESTLSTPQTSARAADSSTRVPVPRASATRALKRGACPGGAHSGGASRRCTRLRRGGSTGSSRCCSSAPRRCASARRSSASEAPPRCSSPSKKVCSRRARRRSQRCAGRETEGRGHGAAGHLAGHLQCIKYLLAACHAPELLEVRDRSSGQTVAPAPLRCAPPCPQRAPPCAPTRVCILAWAAGVRDGASKSRTGCQVRRERRGGAG